MIFYRWLEIHRSQKKEEPAGEAEPKQQPGEASNKKTIEQPEKFSRRLSQTAVSLSSQRAGSPQPAANKSRSQATTAALAAASL